MVAEVATGTQFFFTLAPMVAKVASGKYIAFTYSQVLQDTRGMAAKVAVGIEP